LLNNKYFLLFYIFRNGKNGKESGGSFTGEKSDQPGKTEFYPAGGQCVAEITHGFSFPFARAISIKLNSMRKNKNHSTTFFMTLFLGALTGCTSMMGIKKMQLLEEDQIIQTASAFGIPPANSYVLDTSYLEFIKNQTETLPIPRKDHLQPLQAIYYAKADGFIKPVAWYVNCYAGGYPNLEWNRTGGWNQFPPSPQAPADSLLPLKKHFEFLRALLGVQAFNTIEYDYIVLVYWSRFMGRQSELLIKQVQENAGLAKDRKLRILYVNNDNFFSRMK
jgi:hypothetical protein